MRAYNEYLDTIRVERDLHEKIMRRLTETAKKPQKSRAAFAIFCAAFCLFCVLGISGFLTGLPAPTPKADPADSSLAGLPVNNFNLSDIQARDTMLRIAFTHLCDFFEMGMPQMLAFVRVTRTETGEIGNADGSEHAAYQTSSLRVLSALWSQDGNVPKNILLTQYLYGGCMGDEATKLLREGAVYLLPLWYDEAGGRWYNRSDLDVLLEVDHNGLVWSHSGHEDFRRFDGREASVLADTITAMTESDDFPQILDWFGQTVRHSDALVEVTPRKVTTIENHLGKYGADYNAYDYTLRVESILSTSAGQEADWRPIAGQEIRVVASEEPALREGERYLVFISASEYHVSLYPSHRAIVGEDGRISDFASDSDSLGLFSSLEGMSVAQVREQAERAAAWGRIPASQN